MQSHISYYGALVCLGYLDLLLVLDVTIWLLFGSSAFLRLFGFTLLHFSRLLFFVALDLLIGDTDWVGLALS